MKELNWIVGAAVLSAGLSIGGIVILALVDFVVGTHIATWVINLQTQDKILLLVVLGVTAKLILPKQAY